MNSLHWIPSALIWLRMGLGIAVVALCFGPSAVTGPVCAGLVVVGVLSDVFDGMIARRLKVSTDRLRTFDSRADVLFFVCLVAGLFLLDEGIRAELLLLLVVLGTLEISVHLISFARFRRQSSTHHYASKGFSLLLFGLIVQLFLSAQVTWFYWVVLGAGVLSFLEAGLIMLTIPSWRCDIRSYFDVLKEKTAARQPGESL